jgi:hypothetical protein
MVVTSLSLRATRPPRPLSLILFSLDPEVYTYDHTKRSKLDTDREEIA